MQMGRRDTRSLLLFSFACSQTAARPPPEGRVKIQIAAEQPNGQAAKAPPASRAELPPRGPNGWPQSGQTVSSGQWPVCSGLFPLVSRWLWPAGSGRLGLGQNVAPLCRFVAGRGQMSAGRAEGRQAATRDPVISSRRRLYAADCSGQCAVSGEQLAADCSECSQCSECSECSRHSAQRRL